MRRTATVTTVGVGTYPPSDHQQVRQVDTDPADRLEASFYLRGDGPCPVIGPAITWGDDRPWFGAVVARKVGYGLDPDDVPVSPAEHHG